MKDDRELLEKVTRDNEKRLASKAAAAEHKKLEEIE